MTVIVRFAPSPTGHLHLGGLRTAFYNYLFAKQNKGLFIIRIEDTDQTRVVPSSFDSILNVLNWCNLKADKGPFNPQDYHLYLQSHRVDIYKQKAFELIEKGDAYRCFCTPTRLELLRREAAKNREKIGYDNRCRQLSAKEIHEKLGQKIPFTIRYKLKEKLISFNDLVFGQINTDLTLSESDPIILKSDSFPTYHLANVIDDHDMNITHVLRGTEWLHSTAKHLMIYESLEWKPPEYAHLPLLLNSDKTKLSKRQDDLRVDRLREKGYFAEAIVNFLALSGGGFSKIKGNPIRTLNQLIEDFDLNTVNQNSCQLNLGHLNVLNRVMIKNRFKTNRQDLVQFLKNLLVNKFGKEKITKFDNNYLEFIIEWSMPRINSFGDLIENLDYVWSPNEYNFDTGQFGDLEDPVKILEEVIDLISKVDICLIEGETKSQVANFLFIKTYCDEKHVNYKCLMKLFRLSLINKDKGPPIGELFTVLGKDEFLKRLKSAINYINDNNNRPRIK